MPCLEDNGALSTSPQLGKLLSKEVRVPDIQPNALLTKPHGLFSSALLWTTQLFLTQTPLIPFPGYTPTCSLEPSFVRHVAFLGMLSHFGALAPHPKQEDLRRWIPTTRDQCESPSPQCQPETVGFLQLLYSEHSWKEVEIQVRRT